MFDTHADFCLERVFRIGDVHALLGKRDCKNEWMENRVREQFEGQWDNKRPAREKEQNQSLSVAL